MKGRIRRYWLNGMVYLVRDIDEASEYKDVVGIWHPCRKHAEFKDIEPNEMFDCSFEEWLGGICEIYRVD